jgi:hypothetical protein
MFQTKVVEKIKTHILYSINVPRKSCRLWDNVGKYGTAGQATDGNIIRRMGIACWIPKATDTHSQYVILIDFPLQQWLGERASMLHYTYIVSFVFILQSSCIFPKMVFLYIPYLNLSPLCNSQMVPVPLSPVKQTHIKSYNIITFLHSYLFHKF